MNNTLSNAVYIVKCDSGMNINSIEEFKFNDYREAKKCYLKSKDRYYGCELFIKTSLLKNY